MDDFIYNVRTGNIKNMNKPNRRFDNNRYKGQDRPYKSNNRNPAKDQRKGYVNYRSLSTDQFATLKGLLGTISENQKRQVTIAESVAANQERQTVAIEQIAAHLGKLLKAPLEPAQDQPIAPAKDQTSPTPTEKITTPKQAKHTKPREEVPPTPKASTRPELVALITQMREKRLSYDKIAVEFEKKQIPTLSGRGQWRGQTIYRLFKEG
jgi:hypothetical protein